jgi:pSer/pThr/pTyr-binding forkhead associated (FHA) protein
MCVSRHHARLFVVDGHVHVQDLHSLNGTRVNGKRVQGAVAVQPGDSLDFGFQGAFTLLQFPFQSMTQTL